MKAGASATQHISEEMIGGVTIIRGKILEAIVIDDRAAHSSHVPCACGSGGGCSGGRRKAIPE